MKTKLLASLTLSFCTLILPALASQDDDINIFLDFLKEVHSKSILQLNDQNQQPQKKQKTQKSKQQKIRTPQESELFKEKIVKKKRETVVEEKETIFSHLSSSSYKSSVVTTKRSARPKNLKNDLSEEQLKILLDQGIPLTPTTPITQIDEDAVSFVQPVTSSFGSEFSLRERSKKVSYNNEVPAEQLKQLQKHVEDLSDQEENDPVEDKTFMFVSDESDNSSIGSVYSESGNDSDYEESISKNKKFSKKKKEKQPLSKNLKNSSDDENDEDFEEFYSFSKKNIQKARDMNNSSVNEENGRVAFYISAFNKDAEQNVRSYAMCLLKNDLRSFLRDKKPTQNRIEGAQEVHNWVVSQLLQHKLATQDNSLLTFNKKVQFKKFFKKPDTLVDLIAKVNEISQRLDKLSSSQQQNSEQTSVIVKSKVDDTVVIPSTPQPEEIIDLNKSYESNDEL
jgi:hypothetical protein